MRVLFIGDIVGKPGRSILHEKLIEFKKAEKIDFIIANAENLAGGFGITKKTYRSIIEAGVDFCTSGNHIWDRKEIIEFIDDVGDIIRPANYHAEAPGKGYRIITASSGEKIGILNLSGRIFMEPLDNPFLLADAIIPLIKEETNAIIVDFHAEATSEKIAFGRYLEGRVSAVIGTHTHVQTADECILPGGTAYITDVGMTGAHDSIIGVEKESVIVRFTKMMPSRLTPAKKDVRMSYVIIDLDTETGISKSITRGQLLLVEAG